MAYKRDGDTVVLTMTVEQWESLQVALGYACADAHRRQDTERFNSLLRLVNALNEGNPTFRPYVMERRSMKPPEDFHPAHLRFAIGVDERTGLVMLEVGDQMLGMRPADACDLARTLVQAAQAAAQAAAAQAKAALN